MKILPSVALLVCVLLSGCASTRSGSAPTPPPETNGASDKVGSDGKTVADNGDDLEMYAVAVPVADPLRPLNRATFWVNHQLYVYALRPISKGYEFIVPEKGREAVHNAFENVKFPIRFVNNLLQGNPYRASQETGKFLINTTFGVAGLGRPAERVPFLSKVPPADMGQTFAKWGIGDGFYFVIPVMGPTTLRDGVGLAGDYALNPITWCGFIWGGYGWFIAIPAANTMRSLPYQLAIYDAATGDTLDRYLAARDAYIQYRREVNSRAFQEKHESDR